MEDLVREIKFRAWDTKFNKMVGLGDVRDLFSIRSDGTPSNENYILMQYTGQEDMHNNEIYEGDILIKDGREGKIVVLWDINCFTMPRASWSCEIIGNIYENPELVPKGKD